MEPAQGQVSGFPPTNSSEPGDIPTLGGRNLGSSLGSVTKQVEDFGQTVAFFLGFSNFVSTAEARDILHLYGP